MTVLDAIEELAKAGKISAAIAEEAAAIYRTMIDQGVAADVAALALAQAIRVAAKAQLSSVQFCVEHPDKIPDVAAAMTVQWRLARAGRRAN
jgi:hypothetical protein